jgi:hypothetical protein
MRFPGHKRFAFSILDDTDDSTLENVAPVYGRLRELGFRTTKTVWAVGCPEGSRLFYAADTLEDKAYLQLVHELRRDGFELASHGATMESSPRERTVRALEFLKGEFGEYPRLFCNHAFNRENLYWGAKRFRTRLFRRLFRLVRNEPDGYYAGETEGSEYFWGDVCRRHITYVRNFTFKKLDMLRMNPTMPYTVPDTKYVKYWFSTADAPDAMSFNRLMHRAAIDRLERDGGVCIVSTHFGKGFVRNGQLDPGAERTLEYLAGKAGWFAPVSEILDHLLRCGGGGQELRWQDRSRLEFRFLLDRLGGLSGIGRLVRLRSAGGDGWRVSDRRARG